MCNLYSLTKSQDAIRRITRAMRDNTGNLGLPEPEALSQPPPAGWRQGGRR